MMMPRPNTSRDDAGKFSTSHDMSRTAIYSTWANMVHRCEHGGAHNYADYGGRGIRVCERWRDSFKAFIDDMGPKPTPSHQLDRTDNDGDYCPENCRWATVKEQANNRRNNVRYTFGGKSLTAREWAAELGLTFWTINGRIRSGWSWERIVSTPKLNYVAREV